MGTASNNRCMQRTVVRKHRQRLGQPAPCFEATTAMAHQAKHSTNASRQRRVGRTAMADGANRRWHAWTAAEEASAGASTAGSQLSPQVPGPSPSCAREAGGAPAVHMRVAPPPLSLAVGGGWAITRALVSEPSDPSWRCSRASLDCRTSAHRLHCGGRLEVQRRGLRQGLDP